MTATAAPTRLLRRSRTDRVGAGVAGGRGRDVKLEPVRLRGVLAPPPVFGGAGLLAYLLAWAAIPEDGTERAPIDGWVTKLRARRVPFWLIVVGGVLLLWLVAFSWWAPGPFFPVVVVAIILVVVFGRRGRRPVVPVSLTKAPDDSRPDWMRETRQWVEESRVAGRARSRRAFPVRIATLVGLVAALVTLGLVDAGSGVAVPVYFLVGLGIVGAGLLIGLVLRRTPWSLTPLLIVAAAGSIAFAGSHASLHDGVGQRSWTPTTSLSSSYDVAFGRSTLDLRSLQGISAQTVRMDQAAGEVTILAPRSLDLTVVANVRFGVVTLDGEPAQDGVGGTGVRRVVEPPASAAGPALVVDVHLATGRISVVRS